jgi:hypothetical protein
MGCCSFPVFVSAPFVFCTIHTVWFTELEFPRMVSLEGLVQAGFEASAGRG